MMFRGTTEMPIVMIVLVSTEYSHLLKWSARHHMGTVMGIIAIKRLVSQTSSRNPQYTPGHAVSMKLDVL